MPDSAISLASDARLAGHPSGLRRTFAIISHPDAGKTTLTEKLLLYGGAIQTAGAVKAKRDRATCACSTTTPTAAATKHAPETLFPTVRD